MSQIWQVRDMTDQGFRRYGRQVNGMRMTPRMASCVDLRGERQKRKPVPRGKAGGEGVNRG